MVISSLITSSNVLPQFHAYIGMHKQHTGLLWLSVLIYTNGVIMNVSLCVHTAKYLRSFHMFCINLAIQYIVLVVIYNIKYLWLSAIWACGRIVVPTPFEVRCGHVTCFGQ